MHSTLNIYFLVIKAERERKMLTSPGLTVATDGMSGLIVERLSSLESQRVDILPTIVQSFLFVCSSEEVLIQIAYFRLIART